MGLWTGTGNPGGPFGPATNAVAHLEAVERLKEWTRGRFAIAEDETVVVGEGASALPGFPPLQTGVAFWSADGTRYHFSIFKPVEEIEPGDLPPTWMKEALAASDGFACACC